MKLIAAISAGVVLAVLFLIGWSIWCDGDARDSFMDEG